MELENYHLTEMTLTQKREVNGGFFLEALLVAVVVAVINDWDNFKKGLAGKPEIPKS